MAERDPWEAIYCMECATYLGRVDGPLMGTALCDDCWAVLPAPTPPERVWRCETCNVPAVPAPGNPCWDALHPHIVEATLSSHEGGGDGDN